MSDVLELGVTLVVGDQLDACSRLGVGSPVRVRSRGVSVYRVVWIESTTIADVDAALLECSGWHDGAGMWRLAMAVKAGVDLDDRVLAVWWASAPASAAGAAERAPLGN